MDKGVKERLKYSTLMLAIWLITLIILAGLDGFRWYWWLLFVFWVAASMMTSL